METSAAAPRADAGTFAAVATFAATIAGTRHDTEDSSSA